MVKDGIAQEESELLFFLSILAISHELGNLPIKLVVCSLILLIFAQLLEIIEIFTKGS